SDNHICYLPFNHLYSSISLCSGSSNVMSEKKTMSKTTPSSTVVYARPSVLNVYSQQQKRSSFLTPNSDERTALKRRRIGWD
ncbi:hypothetical protein L195_g049621, partial [Trifolium pratense]